MEIHKPKPFHNLGEFLSEIAIIVIGVSIALIAEQVVEMIHWHHKLDAIEEAMRAELVEDDLPQAYARILIHDCLAGQLNALEPLAKAGANGATFYQAASDYLPPARTWDSDAFRITTQSDVASHLSQQRLQSWAGAYALMPSLDTYAQRERDAAAALMRSRYARRTLTPADADAISDAIDALRTIDRSIFRQSLATTLTSFHALGLTVPDAERQTIWKEARLSLGPCAGASAPTITAVEQRYHVRDVQIRPKQEQKSVS